MRKQPTMAQKLDAALLALMEAKGICPDRDVVKALRDGEVASWHDFDHYPVTVANGGTNHASNLVPRLRAAHREKTAKTDLPAIAKAKRVGKVYEAFRAKLLAKVTGKEEGVEVGHKRGGRRKAVIRNRGFDKTKSRKFNGQVVSR